MTDNLTPETVALDPAYRERLEDAAQRQYSALVTESHDRAREIRQSLADGRSAIGAGTGRYVYPLPPDALQTSALGEYVLKLAVPDERPDGRDGKEQNRREVELWRQTGSRYLVPVAAADPAGYWLVMPRGEPVHEASPELESWAETVTDRLSGVWGSDIDPRNVVRLDGSFRLCDYGVAPLEG